MKTAVKAAITWSAAAFLFCACASIAPGRKGVALTPWGSTKILAEGSDAVVPFSHVRIYDLRQKERNEDFAALTADGASIMAGASLITYRLVPGELAALDSGIGPDYYDIVIAPIMGSVARRTFAAYRWRDFLDSRKVLAAQQAISARAAERLRPFHIILQSVALREITIRSPLAYAAIEETAVEEQHALKAKENVRIAMGLAAAFFVQGRGQAAANSVMGKSLGLKTLYREANRAWGRLLSSPTSAVVIAGSVPLIEIER
ncbi:MAG: SPFH domain-containing protein [Elusimicrobiota bacterium]